MKATHTNLVYNNKNMYLKLNNKRLKYSKQKEYESLIKDGCA